MKRVIFIYKDRIYIPPIIRMLTNILKIACLLNADGICASGVKYQFFLHQRCLNAF